MCSWIFPSGFTYLWLTITIFLTISRSLFPMLMLLNDALSGQHFHLDGARRICDEFVFKKIMLIVMSTK